MQGIAGIAYFIASMLFILGLRDLTHPDTARRGTNLAAIGMLVAVVGTLAGTGIVNPLYIAIGLALGTLIGIPMGLKIPMTMMPERIALSHAFGGLAVSLVGIGEYVRHAGELQKLDAFHMGAISFEVILGALTFTGSLMAFGKLAGILPGKPTTFPGQNAITALALGSTALMAIYLVFNPGASALFYAIFVLGLLAGVLLVLPIGGADMPVVICLLNSYAGLAASASGFALSNPVLIITGALDGGSGFILAMAMSKAMNRSFTNVLFGAFGAETATGAAGGAGAAANVNTATVEEAADIMKYSDSVIVVPGYGMAVAQAQHAVRELASLLEANGTRVRYAIHPVAGRMPGHMNVLLAEANVPYDALFDLDQINDDFVNTDTVLVVGANDVVNPAAKTNPGSPIYGMPVFNCDQAKAVIVLKRSMNPGFAGIENELFVHPKTMMVFGDAKKTIQEMVNQVRGGGGH
ncbi:MAG TPA: NAD(P)(+) transhydrogenase (Re/Si-specific) subunit beta [bacterium]|nr:NAD(P)(+) transhydrogenase (Re/Si-specific) subunit beta [bacterium]